MQRRPSGHWQLDAVLGGVCPRQRAVRGAECRPLAVCEHQQPVGQAVLPRLQEPCLSKGAYTDCSKAQPKGSCIIYMGGLRLHYTRCQACHAVHDAHATRGNIHHAHSTWTLTTFGPIPIPALPIPTLFPFPTGGHRAGPGPYGGMVPTGAARPKP